MWIFVGMPRSNNTIYIKNNGGSCMNVSAPSMENPIFPRESVRKSNRGEMKIRSKSKPKNNIWRKIFQRKSPQLHTYLLRLLPPNLHYPRHQPLNQVWHFLVHQPHNRQMQWKWRKLSGKSMRNDYRPRDILLLLKVLINNPSRMS